MNRAEAGSASDRMLGDRSRSPAAWGGAAFVLGIAILINVAFFRSPGTNDVLVWQLWTEIGRRDGPIAAFCYEQVAPYPPGSYAVLWLASLAFGAGLPAVKGAILAFWRLFVALTVWLGRVHALSGWRMTALAANPAIALSSSFLGYLDITYAGSLLAALVLFRPGLPMIVSGAAFGLAWLMKWQPIIVLPAFVTVLAALVYQRRIRWRDAVLWWTGILSVLALVSLVITVSGNRWDCVADSALRALSDPSPSGDATNLNWLVTWLLHVVDPQRFKPLVNGLVVTVGIDEGSWIRTVNTGLVLVATVYFVAHAWRRAREPRDIAPLAYGLTLAYFVLGYAAHENHSFPLVIVATAIALLFASDNRSSTLLVVPSVLLAANLVLFYGITGSIERGIRVVGGVDTSLVFSVVWLGFFAWYVRASRVGIFGTDAEKPDDVSLRG